MTQHGEGVFPGAPGTKHYYQWWRPAEPDLRAVLATVHGPGRYADACDWFVSDLVPRGYAIYLFEHREVTRLPGRRGYLQEWEECLEDVQGFVRLVVSQEPKLSLFLAGNHLGALMALSHALREPRGLAGVVALGPAMPALPAQPPPVRLSRVLSRIWPAGVSEVTPQYDEPLEEAGPSESVVRSLATPEPASQISGDADEQRATVAHASEFAELAIPHIILGAPDRPVDDAGPAELMAEIRAWLEDRI